MIAINSNNLDTLPGIVTNDVVFLVPQEPVMVGKAALRAMVRGVSHSLQGALG